MKTLLLTLVASISILACAAPPPGSDPSQDPRVTPNLISPAQILKGRDAARIAASAPLSAAGVAGLLDSPDGQELLRHLVSCALPEGSSLVARVAGVRVTFPGGVGLAPGWTSRALDASGRRWISACIIARSNGLGVSVLISMLGPRRELDATTEERSQFPAEEGAFYGDLFASTPDASIPWFACRGNGPADAGGMEDRVCAVADPEHPGLTLCGFMLTGSCASACAFHGSFYSGCRDASGRAIYEVATVRVTP